MPRFLFSYRVPEGYQPGPETRPAWQAWFEGLGSSRIDTGHAVVATRALGTLGTGTRLGGYSLVIADDIDAAAGLAKECPALQLGGGVEIGSVPDYTRNPPAGHDS